MSDQLGTIISVLIGGALTIIGTLLAEFLTSRRTRREAARERLILNLDHITEAVNEMALAVGNGDRSRFNAAKVHAIMLSVKIGDDPLMSGLSKWIASQNALLDAKETRDDSIDNDSMETILRDRHDSLSDFVTRIYELLHVEKNVEGLHKNIKELVNDDAPETT